MSRSRRLALGLVDAFCIGYCFKEFVASIVICDGESMEPTIRPSGNNALPSFFFFFWFSCVDASSWQLLLLFVALLLFHSSLLVVSRVCSFYWNSNRVVATHIRTFFFEWGLLFFYCCNSCHLRLGISQFTSIHIICTYNTQTHTHDPIFRALMLMTQFLNPTLTSFSLSLYSHTRWW